MNSCLNSSLSEIRSLLESVEPPDPEDHKAMAAQHARKMVHHENLHDHAKHMAHQAEMLGHVDAMDQWHARQDHHAKSLKHHTSQWEMHHQHEHKSKLQGVVQKAMDLVGKLKSIHGVNRPS